MCQRNKRKLVLILTKNVSGYTNYIELYWAHLIYVIVWFWQWIIWIEVAQLERNMCKFRCMELMVLFWLDVVYYEIEWSGGWKQCAVNARHSILLPLGHHPSMVIVHFGFVVVKL
jgi:hypothetical protein